MQLIQLKKMRFVILRLVLQQSAEQEPEAQHEAHCSTRECGVSLETPRGLAHFGSWGKLFM